MLIYVPPAQVKPHTAIMRMMSKTKTKTGTMTKTKTKTKTKMSDVRPSQAQLNWYL